MKKKLSKKTGLPLGEYVSRSTYNKVAEENKRLKADIKIIVDPYLLSKQGIANKLALINKYRSELEKEYQFKTILQEIATAQLKPHKPSL